MKNNFKLVLLDKKYDKSIFECEEEKLNTFLRTIAKQKQEANLSKTYIYSDNKNAVRAYITIAYDTLELQEFAQVPTELSRSAKDSVPVVYLLMLARDISLKGQNKGLLLLIEAMKLTYKASEIAGIKGMVLTAINESVAQKFYNKIPFLKRIVQKTDACGQETGIVYYVSIGNIKLVLEDLKKQEEQAKFKN